MLPCWQIPVTDCTQFYPTLTSDAIHSNLCLLERLAEVAGWRIAYCTGTLGRQRTQTLASLNPAPQLKPPLCHLCVLRAQGRNGCSMSFSSTLSHSSNSFLSAFNAVTAGKLSVHNYKNAQHGGSDVFCWSSIWNSTSHWESNFTVVIVLMARGHSENLCLYSQRTAG